MRVTKKRLPLSKNEHEKSRICGFFVLFAFARNTPVGTLLTMALACRAHKTRLCLFCVPTVGVLSGCPRQCFLLFTCPVFCYETILAAFCPMTGGFAAQAHLPRPTMRYAANRCCFDFSLTRFRKTVGRAKSSTAFPPLGASCPLPRQAAARWRREGFAWF